MRLDIRGAAFSYGRGEPVFSGLNFDVREGEILSVLGPNGCGKTTLLKSLVGIQDFTRGTLTSEGGGLGRNGSRTSLFGYVPQITAVAAAYTAFEMVLLGRSRFIGSFERPREEDRRKAAEALEEAGVARLAGRSFSSLSGGERQLVLIARALATEARILVFDEPTSALDLVNQHRTIHLLRRLARQGGYTVVFSTHDPSHALFVSDRTLLMRKNGEALFGPAAEIITEKNLLAVFGVEVRLVEVPVRGGRTVGVLPLLCAAES